MEEMSVMEYIRDSLVYKMAGEYDKMIFQQLEPYGITPENFLDQRGRIVILLDDFYDHYYIDYKYGFSVYKSPGEFIFDDSVSYKARAEYRIEVLDCLKKTEKGE